MWIFKQFSSFFTVMLFNLISKYGRCFRPSLLLLVSTEYLSRTITIFENIRFNLLQCVDGKSKIVIFGNLI